MKSVADVKINIHQRCLNFRALDRLVQSSEFEKAFQSDPHNVRLQFALQSGDIVWIQEWIESIITRELGEMNLRSLRRIAGQLFIPNYTTYTKDELIVLITQVKHARCIEKVAS